MTHRTKADLFLWGGAFTLLTPFAIVIGWKIYDVYQEDAGLVIFGAVCLMWFAVIGFCMSQSEYHRKKSWS